MRKDTSKQRRGKVSAPPADKSAGLTRAEAHRLATLADNVIGIPDQATGTDFCALVDLIGREDNPAKRARIVAHIKRTVAPLIPASADEDPPAAAAAAAAARRAQNAQLATNIADLLHSRVLPANTHNCLNDALDAIIDNAKVRDDPSITQHSLTVALDKLFGVTPAPATVTATSAAGAPAEAAPPMSDQTVPGDLLARMQAGRPHMNSGPQLTPDAVAALCGEIAGRFDDDELAFDLLRVLRGLYQLYEEGLQHDRVFHALEGALIFGQLRAYMHTAHAQFSLEEFSHLDPADPHAQRVLRREFVDEPAAE